MRKAPAYRKKVVKTTSGIFNYAVVRLNGKDHILGKYGSTESKEKYDQVLGEWLSSGRTLEDPKDGLSVTEVCVDYTAHCRTRYRGRNGKPAGEFQTVKRVMRELRRIYGSTPAIEFKALRFKALRQQFIDHGLTRGVINRYCRHVIRAFKLAAENEKLPVDNHQSLQAVETLKKGRSDAKESSEIPPVPEATIDLTIKYLPAIVADMVRIQLLTGMRPGEVTQLRPNDIDQSGEVWFFTPEHHKTDYRDQTRVICLGKRTQEILAPYLLREPDKFCFDPSESMEQMRQKRHLERKTAPQQGNNIGTNRKRGKKKRRPGNHYSTNAYRRAIHRACDDAEIPRWSPNRIRKTAGTKIRSEFRNLEAAQAVLGHKSKSTTERFYARLENELAAEVMKRLG